LGLFFKTLEEETLEKLKIVALTKKKNTSGNKKGIAIKKAVKWDTKKVRRTTTTFVPPTPNVAQPSPMETNFW
jgi:hypothetical protein